MDPGLPDREETMAPSIAVRPGGVHHGKVADVRQVRGPFKELTSELLRLFVLDCHRDEMLQAMGVSREEMAAYRFSTLAEPGGALFVAEEAGRLTGLLFLVPEGLQSAVLGHYIWSVRQLVIAPGAPSHTAGALVDAAVEQLEAPMDCMVARLPARDRAAICGLQRRGFEAVGSEVVGVLRCRERSVERPTRLNIAPLQKRYLGEAADLIHQNGDCLCCPSAAWLQANRVNRLYQCLLAGYVEEPRAGGLVAEGSAGGIRGFLTYRRRIWLGEFTCRSLASLDFFGVHPDLRSNGVGEVLHRHALSALHAESVDAVEVRTSVASLDAARRLKMLRKLGCRAFSSDLIFQRWLNRGPSLC
jgi:ribosomal protein S18 acetylase RimI-like enzyme